MPPVVWAYLPGILALLALSGFFSGSEAAYFSLTLTERQSLAKGNRGSRIAHALLNRSERLLMGILFWNLAINISYFSLVSRIALTIEAQPNNHSAAAMVTLGALILIVIVGEFGPKSLAVMYPIAVAQWVAVPLAVAIRVLDGILPMIKFVNEASRRVLWPGLKPEAYLELADLDRAVELSAEDRTLFEQESQVLRNIIQLGEIRVEEWMRPRTQYRSFQPPISFKQLGGQRTPSGYMLVSDRSGREIVGVIDLKTLRPHQTDDLEAYKQPLVIVPWCATMADVLAKLISHNRRVAAVVNEFGETVGILTREDIFDAVLQIQSNESHREFARAEVYPDPDGEDAWIATGMTKLRKLERVLEHRISDTTNLTVGGIVQEQLHRLPEVGDICQVDDLSFEVIEAGLRGEILVRIRILQPPGED
ncbi:MAG: hemolysin family protein [Pirellulaceae bacterium]